MNRPPKTKLAVALGGALVALSALSANAAGLGKLTINSALGQPLQADIELVSLQPGEFESIVARVASPESYGDAKIEYSPLLRQLRFAVERRSDGKPILKLTSAAPINEPFVDVLVEMNWPAGRLLREYPLLLDPPGFNEARLAPPVTPAVATTPVRPSAPIETAPTAVASTTPPVSSSGSAPVSTASTGTPSAKSESGADTYGPVKRGDTLNKIAQEMKTDTVSLEQMLVALYRENKAAFVDNNMNRLRTGEILKVPSADEVSRIAEKEARSEIKVQVASWQAYREQLAGSAAASTPAPTASSNQASGKIAVAKPEVPVPAATPKDQLKIAKTDTVAGKTGGAGASGIGNAQVLQDQITALKEEKIARENALKEANSRVAILEKQIVDMKKLAELQAAKMAAEAKTTKPADTKVAQVTPPLKAPEPVKAPEPAKVVEPTKPDTKVAEVKPAEVKPPETKPEPAKTEQPKVADAKPAETKPAPKPPVKVAPAKPPEPSFVDEYGMIAGVGLLSVLGIGGLFAFMSRRKKKTGSGSSTSMSRASSIMPSDLKPNTVTGNRGGGLVDTGNSSFLTDFDKTGPGSIDTDEVDPVAEAEVYIAYGRDAQAEEILKEAMSRDKSRHEITVKLLEIYHARKSVQAFETVARELKDAIGGDNPMWAKVAAMGSSIDPQNSLYSGSGQAYETTGAFAAGGATAMAAAAPPDVDFDLGFTDSGATTPSPISAFDVTSPNSDQPAGGGGMDFDLDLNTSGSASASAAAPGGGGLDFDLDSSASSSAAAAPAAPAESSSFDFDLSSLSLDSGDATKPAGADFSKTVATHASGAEKPAMPSLSDLSLDLDTPGGAASDGPSAVSTKLELAKAYIEIGDSDGAKDILTEVSREGSPAQQAEAKKILAGM